MCELNNHVILSHIDSPARILFWPVGQFVICVIPLCLGMVFDYFIIGVSMSIAVMLGFKIFKRHLERNDFKR